MIQRLVCGFQSGADIGAARAAKRFGVPTGGYMPKGWLTEEGPRPEYAEMYGAVERVSASYPNRTRANVESAFALVWFGNPDSPGGRLTIGYARRIGLTFNFIVESQQDEWRPASIARHIINAFEQQKHFPQLWQDLGQTLMAAGNRESSDPGISAWVEEYMCEVFRKMGIEERQPC